MGGVSVDSGGKGGRKSVDSNVNMVPMIDLLISVIAFLLMTAVWVQTGQLQASQPGQGQPSADNTPPEPQLKVIINDSGYRVGTDDASSVTIARDNPNRLEELRNKFRTYHTSFPQKNEVWLTPDSTVKYTDVIDVMDAVYEVWGQNRAPNQLISEMVTIRFAGAH